MVEVVVVVCECVCVGGGGYKNKKTGFLMAEGETSCPLHDSFADESSSARGVVGA